MPDGPKRFQGPFTPASRPASLLSGSVYYSHSMPCSGNADEVCGGPNRLDLYTYGF
jgi:hypothetical protein